MNRKGNAADGESRQEPRAWEGATLRVHPLGISVEAADLHAVGQDAHSETRTGDSTAVGAKAGESSRCLGGSQEKPQTASLCIPRGLCPQ